MSKKGEGKIESWGKEKEYLDFYKGIDEIFDDMVGELLTLLESWGAIKEIDYSDYAKASSEGREKMDVFGPAKDARHRLLKQLIRQSQDRIKQLKV